MWYSKVDDDYVLQVNHCVLTLRPELRIETLLTLMVKLMQVYGQVILAS